MSICQFSIKFSIFKGDIRFGKTQNAIIPLQNLLEFLFSRILKIPLFPDLCKTFFSVYCLSTASQVSPGSDDAAGKPIFSLASFAEKRWQLVLSQRRVFFDSVFNIPAAVVHLYHFTRRKP